jgi:hypothetical protein
VESVYKQNISSHGLAGGSMTNDDIRKEFQVSTGKYPTDLYKKEFAHWTGEYVAWLERYIISLKENKEN